MPQHGIRVVRLNIPKNFAELRAHIRDTARILGEETKAEEIIRDMDARLERLRARRLPEAEWPTIFCIFQDRFAMGSHSTFFGELLEAAGVRNAADQFTGGATISLEAALIARPDMVILTRYMATHPTSTQLNHIPDLFRRIGTEVATASMRDIIAPDPAALNFAEWLQEKAHQIAAKKPR